MPPKPSPPRGCLTSAPPRLARAFDHDPERPLSRRPLALSVAGVLLGTAPVAAPAQARPAAAPVAIDQPAVNQPAVAAAVRAYARAHGFSGTVLVARRGRVLLREGFGLADRAFGVPAAPDTRYWVASVTKLFTAVLVLQLVDAGRLDVEAPIRRYLPDYAGGGADRVTLAQLLHHTSGLAQWERATSYADAVAHGLEAYQLPHPPAELLAKYASDPLAHAPGTTFEYNNADYVVLGAILERVTGLPYDTLLARRLTTPLGLTGTGLLHAQAVVPRLAPTYSRADSAAPLQRDLPVYPENWWAAGGLYSTADDLRAFADALYGGRLLRPATLRVLLTPGLDEYGCGLWVTAQDVDGTKHRFAQRPGRIMGANVTLLRYLDDDLTVVVLGNTNAADVDAFGFVVGRTVLGGTGPSRATGR